MGNIFKIKRCEQCDSYVMMPKMCVSCKKYHHIRCINTIHKIDFQKQNLVKGFENINIYELIPREKFSRLCNNR